MQWKKVTCGALSLVFAVLTGQAQVRPAPTSSGIASSEGQEIRSQYGNVPLMFEANQGQGDSQVKFESHGSGYSVSLTAGGKTNDWMVSPNPKAKRYLHKANKHHELPKGMMYFSG